MPSILKAFCLPRPLPLLAGVVLLLVNGMPQALSAKTVERVGHAFDLKSGEHLYDERQVRIYRDGKLHKVRVHYQKPNGETFATKVLDYSKYALMPDMTLFDKRTGHTEIVALVNQECHVTFRRQFDSTTESAAIAIPAAEVGIVDGGFELFIQRHWDRLLAGETLKPEFLVPVRQAFVDFRVRLVETRRHNGRKLRVFRLEPGNMLVRLITSGIQVTVNDATGALLSYEGISNIRGMDGDNYLVRQSYE